MIYARLACETGWSWEYIGREMTLPRLYAFGRYWKGPEKENAPVEGTREHDAALADFIAGMPITKRPRPA